MGYMLIAELSKIWEEEKSKAMSVDKYFAQLCYKGQERNKGGAGGRSGVRRTFLI